MHAINHAISFEIVTQYFFFVENGERGRNIVSPQQYIVYCYF